MNPNHFLSAAIAYLFGGGRDWGPDVAVGKTLVSSLDASTASWPTSAGGWSRCRSGSSGSWPASWTGSIGFGGEESAGASFLRRDGTVWTTDKDGIIACLLAAELTAKLRPRTPPRCTPG